MKNQKIYSNELDDLQELRENATGQNKKDIQKKIDDIFFKNPIKKKNKKKKQRIVDSDDMWYY